MGHAAVQTPTLLSREEYRRWAEAQPRGRFERLDGVIVQMAPERIAHVRVRARVWRALDRAVRAAGVQCEALGGGVTVEIGDRTDYEPDALVNCGPRLGDDDIAAPNPVVVVEVLSPSARSLDTGGKLAGYFQVTSIQHYLIIAPGRPSVIHHRRNGDGGIETRILTAGTILLDPPGLSVAIEEFYTD